MFCSEDDGALRQRLRQLLPLNMYGRFGRSCFCPREDFRILLEKIVAICVTKSYVRRGNFRVRWEVLQHTMEKGGLQVPLMTENYKDSLLSMTVHLKLLYSAPVKMVSGVELFLSRG